MYARESERHSQPRGIPSTADTNGEGWCVFVETDGVGTGKSGNCQLTIINIVGLQGFMITLSRKLPALSRLAGGARINESASQASGEYERIQADDHITASSFLRIPF